MPAARNYSSTAGQVTLTGAITNVATTMTVSAVTGFPLAPFAGIIDKDRVTEEAVLVTAVVGTTLTITRGYDSTTAVAHDVGATFDHAYLAIDAREAGVHVGNTAGVHGVTGSVVGTTDAQTLTNKTLTAPTINNATESAPTISGGTITGATVSGGTLAGTIAGTPTLSGAVTFSAAPTFSAGAALGTSTLSGTPTFSGAVTFSVAPTFSAGIALGTGTVSGTPTFSGVVTFSAAPTFSLGGSLGTGTFSGAATFSGNVTFSGSPTFSSTTTFTGAATFNGGAALSGTVSGSPTFSGNPSFSGSPSFTNTPTSPANGPFAAWQSFTSSWTGSVSNPSLGNGTLTFNYVLIGKICFFRLMLTMGSTTTFGSGAWQFTVPFTPVASATEQIVSGWALDSAPTTAVYRGVGRISAGAAILVRSHFVDGSTTTTGLTSGAPFTWAVGDQLAYTGFYEIA